MEERRDDWRHGVDENLAAINEGRRATERELNRIAKDLADDDRLLRGDKDKETDGLIARLHQAENEILMLKAVVLKDATGKVGLVADVEALKRQEGSADRHLKLWIAIVGLISTLVVAGAANLDRIQDFLEKKTAPEPLKHAKKTKKRAPEPLPDPDL